MMFRSFLGFVALVAVLSWSPSWADAVVYCDAPVVQNGSNLLEATGTCLSVSLEDFGVLVAPHVFASSGVTPLPALGTADSQEIIGGLLLLLVLAFVFNQLLRVFKR